MELIYIYIIKYFYYKIIKYIIYYNNINLVLELECFIFFKKFKFFLIASIFIYLNVLLLMFLELVLSISNKKCFNFRMSFNNFRMSFCWHWISMNIFHEANKNLVELIVKNFSFSLITILIHPYRFYYPLSLLLYLSCQ